MARVFYSNFDFEHRLAGVSRKTAAIVADLSTAWLAMARPDDCVVGMQDLDGELATALKAAGREISANQISRGSALVSWGWDQSALDFAHQHGLTTDAPPLRSVADANSRCFSFSLEREWACGLDGSARVTSLPDFHSKTAELEQWIAKAEYSMSSRERVPGRGSANEMQANWAKNRFDEGSAVFVEPLVHIQDECGVQFEIFENGDVELVGITGLVTTEKGGFAGCLIGGEDSVPWADLETTRRAAEAAARLGYFGPFGIDSARYELNGVTRQRPLQDINARYTMGRLALGWRDLLHDGESAVWLFLPSHNESAGKQRASAAVRVIPTSPRKESALKSVLLISDSMVQLRDHALVMARNHGRDLRWPATK